MISVDGSVFIQVINFIFLIWILNLVLYKPIRKILIQRKGKVEGIEQEIETFNSNASEKVSSFKSGIKEARNTGVEDKKKLITEANDEEKKIVAEINSKYQAELASVRKKIVKDAESARVALQKELDVFADSISEKILGRAV